MMKCNYSYIWTRTLEWHLVARSGLENQSMKNMMAGYTVKYGSLLKRLIFTLKALDKGKKIIYLIYTIYRFCCCKSKNLNFLHSSCVLV